MIHWCVLSNQAFLMLYVFINLCTGITFAKSDIHTEDNLIISVNKSDLAEEHYLFVKNKFLGQSIDQIMELKDVYLASELQIGSMNFWCFYKLFYSQFLNRYNYLVCYVVANENRVCTKVYVCEKKYSIDTNVKTIDKIQANLNRECKDVYRSIKTGITKLAEHHVNKLHCITCKDRNE